MDTQTCDDVTYMRRALQLASQAYGQTAPNPLVGAVVVRDGRIVGEGTHRRAGARHAEPQALDAAAAHRRDAQGARDLTLFVNLEPCCHQGLTPPCVEAIVASRVGRVVVAMLDPDPRVAGAGLARMRAAGLRVETGCLEREAEELNHVFVARQRRGRPFVALKVALSADGCIAAADGAPRRITGEAAQRHAHRLRAGYDGILIGVETLRRDRPRLDRRLYDGPGRAPRRIVVDPKLRSRAEWLWDDTPPALVLCAEDVLRRSPAAAPALAARARFVGLPRGRDGLDVEALLQALQTHEVWSVLVEGGGRTHAAFLAAGFWDRVYLYRNPRLRLDGLAWSAAEAWRRAAPAAALREPARLGDDELSVHVHRDSVLGAES
jgi:diaminohydroxyphosphoribosylaminopyrimidine deaminase/5-amino-6-(5-phosphoribosylamino)uracil reductase